MTTLSTEWAIAKDEDVVARLMARASARAEMGRQCAVLIGCGRAGATVGAGK